MLQWRNPVAQFRGGERFCRGALQLVPTGDALKTLSADYALMVEDDLLFDEAETFDKVLDHC